MLGHPCCTNAANAGSNALRRSRRRRTAELLPERMLPPPLRSSQRSAALPETARAHEHSRSPPLAGSKLAQQLQPFLPPLIGAEEDLRPVTFAARPAEGWPRRPTFTGSPPGSEDDRHRRGYGLGSADYRCDRDASDRNHRHPSASGQARLAKSRQLVILRPFSAQRNSIVDVLALDDNRISFRPSRNAGTQVRRVERRL